MISLERPSRNRFGPFVSQVLLVALTLQSTAFAEGLLNRPHVVTDPSSKQYTHGYDENGTRESLAYTNGTRTAEYTTAGSITAYYVRGDDLLSVIRAGEQKYFHADGIGSSRKLTDDIGTVSDSYDYEAFGTLLAHTGNDPQPYAFTGEPLDPNSGFQYHRARWMDPRIGRFAGMDPWIGSEYEPSTLHRYAYCAGEPVARKDPSGRVFITLAVVEILLVATAAMLLAAVAVVQVTSASQKVGRHTIGRYGIVAGHHPHQQAARYNNPNYRPRQAIAVKPDTYNHQAINAHQRYLNRQALLEFEEHGTPYTLEVEERIQTEAMRATTFTVGEIQEILQLSRQELIRQGALEPTRIPGQGN